VVNGVADAVLQGGASGMQSSAASLAVPGPPPLIPAYLQVSIMSGRAGKQAISAFLMP
jgi:hypothetical protein